MRANCGWIGLLIATQKNFFHVYMFEKSWSITGFISFSIRTISNKNSIVRSIQEILIKISWDDKLLLLRKSISVCKCLNIRMCHISLGLLYPKIWGFPPAKFLGNFPSAQLCTGSLFFECEFGFFRQKGGIPMGGPLSRCLVDVIVKKKIENKSQNTPSGDKYGIGYNL